MTDLLIIGGGLSGLFSACLAVMNNLKTTILMRGRGGLSLSHGAIELYDRASPSRAIYRLEPPHPYALVGKEKLISGLEAFLKVTKNAGLTYQGGRSSNKYFITASGRKRAAAYLPASYFAGDLDGSTPGLTVGNFEFFRDFQPIVASARTRLEDHKTSQVVSLSLLHPFTKRDIYPQDAARMFDDLNWTLENARAWKPKLIGAKMLGLPAVLGLRKHKEVIELLEETLSIPIFEIPTLPPSIPGLRLENGLRKFATSNGAQIIEGPVATGRVRQEGNVVRSAGAVLASAAGRHSIEARSTILATGSFLHGGLIATQNNQVYESVFNLPVETNKNRDEWTQRSIFDGQGYTKLGVRVNKVMQPLDIHGDPMFDNLYAVGGLIQGADRTLEGSRQGIDVATAFCAVEHISRSNR